MKIDLTEKQHSHTKSYHPIVMLLLVGMAFWLLMQTPLWHMIKSYTIMLVYSTYEEQQSFLKEAGVSIDMPGGQTTKEQDWYPFVMTFNTSEGLSRYMKRDLEATILYNFGAYLPFSGSSLYLDPTSIYYNGFYGAYAVKDKQGGAFGYDDKGDPIITDMAMVPEYDMKKLVLESIGCSDPQFSYKVTDQFRRSLVGYEDWFVFDADIRTNGSYHRYQENHMAYIQYGQPLVDLVPIEEDFELIDMKGRIYSRYFPEIETTIFFYIIVTSQELLETTEKDFILESRLHFKR